MADVELDIPEGLGELLEDFTVEVLRYRPNNIIQFAADYFANLVTKKASLKKGSSRYSTKSSVQSTPTSSHHVTILDPPEYIAQERPNDDSSDEIDYEQLQMCRKSVAGESFDPTKISLIQPTKVFHPKTHEQRERLRNVVTPIILFRCLDEEQIEEVIDAMFEKKVTAGEVIMKEGNIGDNLYVVEHGTFDIVKSVGKNKKKVGQIVDNGSFGELALMYNTPRAATVTAVTDGILWAMDRATFKTIVLLKAFEKRTRYEKLLETVPLLSELSQYERMSVADALVGKIYEKDAVIIKQGDPGEQMYFIESGEVVVTCRGTAEEGERQISILKPGSYFGELALVTKKPRAATVTTLVKTKVAVLDITSFERLLGPCIQIMKRNIANYSKQMESIFDTD